MEYKLKECDMDRLATKKMLWRRVDEEREGRSGRVRREKAKLRDTATALALALAQFRETEWTLSRAIPARPYGRQPERQITARRSELFLFFLSMITVTAAAD